MSGSHRIEVSPNNRAVCKNTECKKQGIKIQKGQIRYGTFITGPQFQSWTWKHWGCVTPKQISNLKESIEGDPSQLDGYDELPEDCQEKVVDALEQGHIADEDWSGDIEMNRQGKNGYFTPETKRRMKAEARAIEEEAAGEGSASPSKTNKKKRSHIKDDPDAEGAAEDEPPAKKTKARVKKEKKIKIEDADRESESQGSAIKDEITTKNGPKIKNKGAHEGSGNEGPAARKAKPRVKREPKVKNEDADNRSDNEGPSTDKSKPGTKNELKIKDEDPESNSEIHVPMHKMTKASTKKGKKAIAGDADGSVEQEAQPVQKGRKRVKKAAAEDGAASDVRDESSDHQILQPRRLRAPRKAAMSRKIKDESTETDGPDPASELETPFANVKLEHTSGIEREASEDALELQEAHTKASKKAVNGKAKAKRGSKPK